MNAWVCVTVKEIFIWSLHEVMTVSPASPHAHFKRWWLPIELYSYYNGVFGDKQKSIMPSRWRQQLEPQWTTGHWHLGTYQQSWHRSPGALPFASRDFAMHAPGQAACVHPSAVAWHAHASCPVITRMKSAAQAWKPGVTRVGPSLMFSLEMLQTRVLWETTKVCMGTKPCSTDWFFPGSRAKWAKRGVGAWHSIVKIIIRSKSWISGSVDVGRTEI